MRQPITRFIMLASVVVFACDIRLARGDEWSVTTADFKTQPITLRGLSADGLHVASTQPSGDQVMPFDQFVSAQRPAFADASIAKFTLSLAGGDRLVGEPGSVASEKLTWISPSLGKIPVPFSRLVEISRGGEIISQDDPPKQDIVTLANGDTVAGVFTDCIEGKVVIQGDAGPNAVPLANINRIVFATAGPAAATSNERAFRVRLTDGSTITAAVVTIDGDRLKLTLPGKTGVIPELSVSNLLSVEQLNGPVSWLSSHTPNESIQTPYVGGAAQWPATFDKAVDGSPLQFDGHLFDHGIGVHAYSRLTFAIDPQWAKFRTQYAIDSRRDSPSKFADVIVRVKIDGKIVHEQQHVRGGVLSPVVEVDLKDGKSLTLECDYGDAGDTQARLDWLEPALLRVR